MAEIFISYARVDRERAHMLAGALAHEGWSVWWDRDIPPGRTFDDVIEEALTAARCVIVLWSRDSVRSEWVKAEASEAARRRILVPVLADAVMPPLEFRRIQSAALLEWGSLTSNPDWSHLCQAVGTLVGRPAVGSPSTSPNRADQRTATTGAGQEAAPTQARARSRPRPSAGVLAAGALAVVVGLAWPFVFHRQEPALSPRVDSDSARVARESPVSQVDSLPAPREEPSARGAPPSHNASTKPAASDAVAPPAVPLERPSRDLPRTAAPRASELVGAGRRELAPNHVMNAAPAREISATRVEPGAAAPSAGGSPAVKDAPDPIAPPPPRASGASSFDVAYSHGVFRESGRLTISSDGVRYAESDGRSSFDAGCNDVRRVQVMTVIVDREQRMVELHLKDGVHRFTTESTAARNGLVSALARACGTH